MKRIKWGACILSLVLLLSACGQSATPDSVGKGKVSELVDSLTNKDTPDMSDVENNGGNYVRVGNRVYFRKYGPDALYSPAMFGDFLPKDVGNGVDGESEIAYIDLTTGEVKTVFKDVGFGGLYVVNGSFYLQEYLDVFGNVVRYSLDGATSQHIQEGELLGVTDSGLLAVEKVRHGIYTFSLYRDGEYIHGFQFDEESTAMIYAGLSDDGLFLLKIEYESETDAACSLWQCPVDGGEAICLGTLPETEYMYSTEPEQFISSDTQIGLVVGYYAGTGHFLNDLVVVTATPGVENSLSVFDTNVDYEVYFQSEYLPRLSVSEGGDIVSVPYLPGEVEIGWEEEDKGDLKVYDGERWQTVFPEFLPERADGSGYQRISQALEYVGDTVYVTLANAYASPLDDIGWRSAYRLLNLTYLAVSADGRQTELASVDYDTVLQGNAWFLEGTDALLLQQNTFEEDVWKSETDDAFMIPIAANAEWDDKDAILSEAVYTEPTELLDYGGWTLPEAEGQFLCLRLNRDGEAVFLTAKSPDALLTIDVGVSEAELSDTVENISPAPRPSDEDTPWYWSRLTALESGVTLLIERTPDDLSETEEIAMTGGEFVPGSVLFRRVMNRGESVGLYASLPWHPEIRVSAMRNGAYGAYAFGDDNYLHEEPVNGRFAQKILAGYQQDDSFTGSWLYRDPDTGAHTAKVDILDDIVGVNVGDEYRTLTSKLEHLHTETWETPDLLCLTAEDADTIAALQGMGGNVGDYYIERFQTDGEDILHLTQVNNGDAALDILLPHQSEFLFDVVLHSYHGAAEPAAPLRNVTLTAKVAKVESARNVIWLREAQAYEWDELTTLYCVKPAAACAACPLASPELLRAFADCDAEYPMKTCRVTIDRDGLVTALE